MMKRRASHARCGMGKGDDAFRTFWIMKAKIIRNEECKKFTSEKNTRVVQGQTLFTVTNDTQSIKIRQADIRYREGIVAKSDILASTVSLADAKQNYVIARGEYEKSMANLNNIIGLPTETPLLIHDETNYTTYEPTEESCVEYALENRPDYFSAEYSIKQAEAAIKIAEAGRKPTVDASLSKTAEGDRIFKSDTSRNWQAMLNLQWNIFDNGVTSASVNEMRARLRKTQSIATQLADSIHLEVHNAYIDLRTAEENISTTQIAVARAEEDYHLAQIRYTEGVGINLEVIDAQEKLTQARTNYFSALYSYYLAKAELEKAMGVPVEFDPALYVEAENNGESAANARKKAAVIENEAEKFVDKPFSTKENDNETEKKESPNEKFSFAAK